MTRSLAIVVSALLCVAVCGGCARGWQIRGRAVRGSSGPGLPAADSSDRNLPLTEARVSIECPEEMEEASQLGRVDLRADMDGRFRGSGEGTLPPDCFIAVEAPGYNRETFRVSEVCASEPTEDETGCSTVAIQATLPPSI